MLGQLIIAILAACLAAFFGVWVLNLGWMGAIFSYTIGGWVCLATQYLVLALKPTPDPQTTG